MAAAPRRPRLHLAARRRHERGSGGVVATDPTRCRLVFDQAEQASSSSCLTCRRSPSLRSRQQTRRQPRQRQRLLQVRFHLAGRPAGTLAGCTHGWACNFASGTGFSMVHSAAIVALQSRRLSSSSSSHSSNSSKPAMPLLCPAARQPPQPRCRLRSMANQGQQLPQHPQHPQDLQHLQLPQL